MTFFSDLSAYSLSQSLLVPNLETMRLYGAFVGKKDHYGGLCLAGLFPWTQAAGLWYLHLFLA